MKPARWGISLPFATLGAEYGRLASHVFVDDSAAPICQPAQAGSPGVLVENGGWPCQECDRLRVTAWWATTSFAKRRLWVASTSILDPTSLLPGAAGKLLRAEGYADTDADAFAQACAAIARLVPASAPTIIRRGSESEAVKVAREHRAEARDRKASSGTTNAQVVEYVYRHHKAYDYSGFRPEAWSPASGDWSWFFASSATFTWKTETAKVLRRTAKRLFVEDTFGSYNTAGGSLVLKTYALDRAALERGTHRWGWTLNPHPPADGQESTPAWATVLEIELPTTLAEAKRAYRRKAKDAHPDGGGSPEAFRRVTEAFAAATAHFGAP